MKQPRRTGPAVACVWLALLFGCSKNEPAPATAAVDDRSEGVALSPEQVRALGITTVPAHATDYRASIEGFGVVVSLDSFAQTYADIATASASAAQSAAALARAQTLAAGEDAAVSREVLETAVSKAAADQAALALAQRKSESVFGLQPPWRTAEDRKKVMDRLSLGRAVLVHVTFPQGRLSGERPDEVAVGRIGPASRNWRSKVLWPSPADPAVPGSGFFVLLEGSDLAQGEHVFASTGTGERLAGVWIPQTALLLSESSDWAYIETKPGRYVRVRVDTSRPDNAGYVLKVGAGISPGQNVVVTGAGLLLAHELNPSGSGGD